MEDICGEAAILVDPLDVENMEYGIASLSKDSLETSNMVAKGLDKARLYSWRTCADLTLEAYKHTSAG